MGAQEKAAAARAKMDQTRRELAERRALRHRKAQEAKEKTKDSLRAIAPAMAQAVEQQTEVAQRREQAGGWATEKIDSDKNFVMAFGMEGEGGGQATPPPYPPAAPPPPAAAASEPGAFGMTEDDDAPAAAPPAAAPPPPAPPRPVRETRARQREVLDDEDDFSNQSSWMRNE